MDHMAALQVQVNTFAENAAGDEYLREEWGVEGEQEASPRLTIGFAVGQTNIGEETFAPARGFPARVRLVSAEDSAMVQCLPVWRFSSASRYA